MIDDSNRHCTETKYSCRYHYRNSGTNDMVACGIQDDVTHIELQVKPRGYPRMDFEIPRQRHALENVERALSEAYEQGRRDNRIELAELLKKLIAI